MLKKILKAVTMFTLLVGCYFGYVRVFAVLVEQFRATRRPDKIMFRVKDSKSKKESIVYARDAFGRGHWSAAEDLAFRYYNAERGFWMYAQEWERVVEENGVRYDGKRMRLRPFALIMKSRDGKNTKTVTADVAIFDLNEPLSFNVSAEGEPLKIKHAHLEPNVEVRDDKSTPGDKTDDMRIGPILTVDFDDATHQITTDSYVVIQDPDMVATGDGMLIQLRKDEEPRPAGSPSGFEGAERMDLNKNVHVVIHDVGKSGILPGSTPNRRAAKQNGQAKAQVASGTGPAKAQAKPVDEPTPLDLRCLSKMQVYLPKPQLPVRIGPPDPPAPTFVQFERDVVALRGPLDDQPDQLTCDTLNLRLVPGDMSAPGAGRASESTPGTEPGGDGNKGLFGNLTLQRAWATGYAVWLNLPASGVKLRCNELIHWRQAPYKPDLTYFRGDRTRPLDLWKVDVVQEEGPDKGKVSSVTHIKTVDANMYDNGNGMDTANVVATGPGRLETQPDRDQPVERIAIWQDKLYLRNVVGPDGQVLQKIVDLTGNRPCFIDNVQKTSLDSARWITVWLKPKPRPAATPWDEGLSSRPLAGVAGTGEWTAESTVTASPTPTAFSRPAANDEAPAGTLRGSDAPPGGGNFQIERLRAIRDVHLIAPAKTMTARERLDADFVDAAPAAVATAAPAKGGASSSSTATNTAQVQEPGSGPAPGQEQVAAQDQAETPAPEPLMVGSADRVWAKIEVKPNTAAQAGSSQGTPGTGTKARTASGMPGSGETTSEIRNVWMWGSVSLHQDPEQGETKGKDASGEAVYLDNRGPGKVISYVYQREPNEKTYLPGPLPPARVENGDMKITAVGQIKMNQETDQAWVEGPGTLTQLAVKNPPAPAAAGAADPRPAGTAATRAGVPQSQPNTRATTVLTQNEAKAGLAEPQDQPPASKPKTRAGRPVTGTAPTTIAFSERMEFTGRTTDPEGTPAARAEFYGIVTAQMEDALLHAEQKMIAWTDRVVPLAQLGAMSKSRSKPKPGGASDPADAEGEADTQPQLTLIHCFHRAVGINRKIDPDTPTLLQKQRVEADDILAYDRRTGLFDIPRKGIVYLYDRSDNSSRAPGMNLDSENGSPNPTATERPVTPTARRVENQSSRTAGASAASTRSTAPPAQPNEPTGSKAGEFPPLVLTQIKFIKGMRGRFGNGLENNTVSNNWYEFFGDIQLARAKVPDAQTILNFDKLPGDGLFLTSQTLRVITEPPPAGSPPSTPARDFLKAWEKAYVWSSDKSLQADVITYDSEKDLIYAFGEEGRGVSYGQQHATGQPSSLGTAKAMRLNPKTGAMHLIDNASVQLIDKNTGVRPVAANPVDPDAKVKKPPRRPFRLPAGNVERRGFTGQ
ncbi:MAG: hypothetical protein ACHRXM_08180 [Isosphaerales bacterium]